MWIPQSHLNRIGWIRAACSLEKCVRAWTYVLLRPRFVASMYFRLYRNYLLWRMDITDVYTVTSKLNLGAEAQVSPSVVMYTSVRQNCVYISIIEKRGKLITSAVTSFRQMTMFQHINGSRFSNCVYGNAIMLFWSEQIRSMMTKHSTRHTATVTVTFLLTRQIVVTL